MTLDPFVRDWAVAIGGTVALAAVLAVPMWLVVRRQAAVQRRSDAAAAAAGIRAVEVTREQAPALFAVVHEVGTALGTPPVRRIMVTEDIDTTVDPDPNADVLRIGLLMLATLPPDEARAEITRALAPLAMRRGNYFRDPHRHKPYGAGREQIWRDVHQLDALAARVAGTGAAARALVRVEALVWYSAELVRDLLVLAIDHPEPPFEGEFSYHRDLMANARLEGRAGRWLTAQMDPPDDDWFHDPPPLGPRLRAMGVAEPPPEALRPAGHTAAPEWLGDALSQALAAEFDRHHDGYLTTEWPRWHREAQEELRRLAELDARALARPLTTGEAVERADLIAIHRPDQARAAYEALADRSHAARSALGRLLLKQGDDAGIAHLERLAAEAASWAIPALEDIATYLQETGRGDRAREFRRRAAARRDWRD